MVYNVSSESCADLFSQVAVGQKGKKPAREFTRFDQQHAPEILGEEFTQSGNIRCDDRLARGSSLDDDASESFGYGRKRHEIQSVIHVDHAFLETREDERFIATAGAELTA